jgi:putative Mg2+ transporter-C (MgtC) family protein
MRRDIVPGLTTAASVWLSAALGMAYGARLPVLAAASTIGHFVTMKTSSNIFAATGFRTAL